MVAASKKEGAGEKMYAGNITHEASAAIRCRVSAGSRRYYQKGKSA
jgi:hypothetical protein